MTDHTAALRWTSAALQGLVNGNLSDLSTFTVNGETKTIEQILDMANAALDQPQQPSTPPAPAEPQGEPIYQLQNSEGLWLDQDESSYQYNRGNGWPVRIIYASPPPQQPAQGWQPIETAPKDGSRVLIWHPDYMAPTTAQWYGAETWKLDSSVPAFWNQPTHWMPIPAAPAMTAAQDAVQGGDRG